MARELKFRLQVEEILYYPSSENKDADQLCSYCPAHLRLCFHIGKICKCSLVGRSGRASDSESRGPGFDPHKRHRVVSLSKAH